MQKTLLFVHGNDLNVYYLLTEIYDSQRLKVQVVLRLCDSGQKRDPQCYYTLVCTLPTSFSYNPISDVIS
jgi:hypothetical protein